MKKDILFKIVVGVVLYLIQFVIAPMIWPRYYPSSNEATGILVGLIMYGMFFLGDCFYFKQDAVSVPGRYDLCCANVAVHESWSIRNRHGWYSLGWEQSTL